MTVLRVDWGPGRVEGEGFRRAVSVCRLKRVPAGLVPPSLSGLDSWWVAEGNIEWYEAEKLIQPKRLERVVLAAHAASGGQAAVHIWPTASSVNELAGRF